ncbi:hypothetical protein Fmac_018966 [Flemingia macrophylla]|uniref:Uncharacterized protein n=1 Tax=Flemingia macrophylla TaxID=520843 RepID=A0ABD1M8G1_9FABA
MFDFGFGVEVDLDLGDDSNDFCLPCSEECDPCVEVLLFVVRFFGILEGLLRIGKKMMLC